MWYISDQLSIFAKKIITFGQKAKFKSKIDQID